VLAGDEVHFVLRQPNAGLDVAESFEYRVEGTISDIMDGSERLVSLISVPLSRRQVFPE
jgi:hypothetical protein